MSHQSIDLEEALQIVRQLSPGDQTRLVERITQTLPIEGPLESLYGLMEGKGPSPSIEDIKEVRREMWAYLDDFEV